MTETKTITLKLDVSVQPAWGKRGVRAVLGPFVEEGPKMQCIERLKTRVAAAVTSADTGAIVAAGLADGFVYVLHCGYDGCYQISSFRPEPGSVGRHRTGLASRTFEPGKRVDAVEYFERFVAEQHDKGGTMADSEKALRQLASQIGVSTEGTFADVAQRIGLVFAEASRREDFAANVEQVARLTEELARQGASIESTALAKLLGWPKTYKATALQQVAREIVVGSRVSSLADLASYVGGVNVLHSIDLAVERIADDTDDKMTLEEAEEHFAKEGWDDDEPLDQAIAKAIKDPEENGLTKLAKAALLEHYIAKPSDDELADAAEAKQKVAEEIAEQLHQLVERVEWFKQRRWAQPRTRQSLDKLKRWRNRASQWRLAYETLASRVPTANDNNEVLELRGMVERLKLELRHRCMLPAEIIRELDL